MADKPITLKRHLGSGSTDNLYPTTTWAQLLDIPATFTPTAHTHAISDVTSLQTTLDGKVAGPASSVDGYVPRYSGTTGKVINGGLAVTDSTGANALTTGTGLVTERDVYYGLPNINNSHAYTSANGIYAATTVGSAGQVASSTGSGAPSYRYLSRAIFLASNFTNATTTLNPVTGLTFAMEAGKKYRIRFLGTFESATSTTGCLLGINLSAGTATVRGYAQGEIVASEVSTGLRKAIYTVTTTAGAAGSFITTTGMSAPGTYQALEMDLAIQCATAGSIRVLFASEVASSTATLHAGAVMIVDELSV